MSGLPEHLPYAANGVTVNSEIDRRVALARHGKGSSLLYFRRPLRVEEIKVDRGERLARR